MPSYTQASATAKPVLEHKTNMGVGSKSASGSAVPTPKPAVPSLSPAPVTSAAGASVNNTGNEG